MKNSWNWIRHNQSGRLVDEDGRLESDNAFTKPIMFDTYAGANNFVHFTLEDAVVTKEDIIELEDVTLTGYTIEKINLKEYQKE